MFGKEGVETRLLIEFEGQPAAAPLTGAMQRQVAQTDLKANYQVIWLAAAGPWHHPKKDADGPRMARIGLIIKDL